MASPATSAVLQPLVNVGVRPAKVTWNDLDSSDVEHLGCLSTVCGPANPAEWWNMSFLIPHEPIRYGMLLMEQAIQPQYLQSSRYWKIERFYLWYNKYFYAPVHHHHDIEEKIFFPWVLTQGKIVLPDRMSADHVTLMKGLDDIKDMEKQFKQARSDPTQLEKLGCELRSRVIELCSLMYDHIAEEERLIPVILKEYSTRPAVNGVEAKIVKQLDPATSLLLLPDIIRCQYRAGGDPAKANLLAKLPRPLRWQYRKYSNTWYENEYLALVSSIRVDSDIAPSLPKHRGWWIFRYYKEEDKPEWMKQLKKPNTTTIAKTTIAAV